MGALSQGSRRMQEKLYAGASLRANPFNKQIFADSVNGNDGNSGDSPRHPVASLTRAYALADAGDTIIAVGSFSEALVVAKAGLKIIGGGNRPKECQWTSATDTASLTISANYVEVANIYFKPPTYTAGVPASIKLLGANHAWIHDCRFQGQTASWNAIYSAVCDSDNVVIEDCEFMYLNTATYGAAILGLEAGGLSYSGWKILRNTFSSCVTAVNINGRCCRVEGNIFMEYGIAAAGTVGAVCTKALDLSGTSSGGNMVFRNQFQGDYDSDSGLYTAGASGDNWMGNYSDDVAETEVDATGLTVAVPAV